MRKSLLPLCLAFFSVLSLAAGSATSPVPKKPRRFNRPENPVIRIMNVKLNGVKMWQVEVVKGTLELKNRTVLKRGSSVPLLEDQIIWVLGQIVLIGEDGVWAGGGKWKKGDRLFVDEKGRFLLIFGKTATPTPAE
jgi:hypothetical protein